MHSESSTEYISRSISCKAPVLLLSISFSRAVLLLVLYIVSGVKMQPQPVHIQAQCNIRYGMSKPLAAMSVGAFSTLAVQHQRLYGRDEGPPLYGIVGIVGGLIGALAATLAIAGFCTNNQSQIVS